MRSLLYLILVQLCAGFLLAAEPPAAFGLTNVWTIELRVSPDVWRTLINSRDFKRADITINGVPYANVAVRQKGGGTTDGTWS